jgi:hypothetical protein
MKHYYSLALTVTLLSTTIALGQSQKLQDFQAAANVDRGCDTIPYDSLKRNCQDQGKNVHEWCDGGRGPVKCESGVTAALVQSLVQEHKNEDRLQAQRRDLDDKRNHTDINDEKSKYQQQIEAADKEIEASRRKMDEITRNTSNRKDLVDKTIDTINKCIDYRQATMNVFGDALDKVRQENEPDIKPLAVTLKGKYQDEKEGHQTQITDKENSIKTCKDERP